jgi:hypothetical protein
MSRDFRRKPVQLMVRKVTVINFRPAAVPTEWNNAHDLVSKYISAMRQITNNFVIFQIMHILDVPKYPILLDGRQYNDTTWTQAMKDDKTAFRDSHGSYMLADYQRIMQEFNIPQAIKSNEIDEVWMFGGPYFGFYESRMVGRGAFWCNAPGIEMNSRRFIMMGYNYQRDVKEMVHDFGHRAESILAQKYGSQGYLQGCYSLQANPTPKNDFEQFLLTHGTCHRKPGGEDYGQDEAAWLTSFKPEWFPFAVDPNKVA